jgi:hypothetical protein
MPHHHGPGLPDGLFSYPKSQFDLIFEDIGLEFVVIFYGHLVYFTDMRDIL